MVVDGGDLYVAGAFTEAGGVNAARIARWDGASWHTLGQGFNSDVYDLAIDGTDLYAAGHFEYSGGTSLACIARWDGAAWHPIGGGVYGGIGFRAIAIAPDGNGHLYVGGEFTTAGGLTVSNIAMWDGAVWSSMSGGVNGVVGDLVVNGDDVIACGSFATAGGTSAMHIAAWDGDAWSALGSGIIGYSVSRLAVGESGVYVSGWFWTAGGKPSSHIARWGDTATGIEVTGDPAPGIGLVQSYPNPFNGTTTIRLQDSGIEEGADVTLRIYDASGRLVRTLLDGGAPRTGDVVVWDGTTDLGRPAASGVYFCRLDAGRVSDVCKITLLK
jgi:hypothetical protein